MRSTRSYAGAGAAVRAEVLAHVAKGLRHLRHVRRGNGVVERIGRRQRTVEQLRGDDVREAFLGAAARR